MSRFLCDVGRLPGRSSSTRHDLNFTSSCKFREGFPRQPTKAAEVPGLIGSKSSSSRATKAPEKHERSEAKVDDPSRSRSVAGGE